MRPKPTDLIVLNDIVQLEEILERSLLVDRYIEHPIELLVFQFLFSECFLFQVQLRGRCGINFSRVGEFPLSGQLILALPGIRFRGEVSVGLSEKCKQPFGVTNVSIIF